MCRGARDAFFLIGETFSNSYFVSAQQDLQPVQSPIQLFSFVEERALASHHHRFNLMLGNPMMSEIS